MRVRDLLAELHYVGEATGVRHTYSVFRDPQHDLPLSCKKDGAASGNFNIIPADAVAYVEGRSAGRKGLTATDLFEESKRTGHIKGRFGALNTLYVLVAAGKASIDHRYKAGALVFNLV